MNFRTTAVIVAILAFAAAACGGDTISENLAEKIIEDQSGGDVDIDIDDGGASINIETDEGSFSIGSGELPDGLTIPVPDGGDVQSSFETEDNLSVMVEWPGSEWDRLVAFYEDWTDSQSTDFKHTSSEVESDDGTVRSVSWYDSDSQTQINVVTCYRVASDSYDGACVQITE